MTALRKVGFSLLVLLSIGIAGYGVFALIDPKQTPLIIEKLKDVDFHYTPWVYILYIHIVGSMFSLLVGPFQFLPKVIQKKRLHRALGVTYVLSILFGGLAGLVLAVYASGGLIAKTGFAVLSVLWLFSTFTAMKKIRDRRIQEHQQWMYRSMALTLAAVSLRIWLPILMILTKGDFSVTYPIVAWLCWVPNLLLVELWLRRRSNTPSSPHVTPSVR